VRIKNTLSLGIMDVSLDLLPQALPGFAIRPIGEPAALPFDLAGNLSPIG
jgi:hypothetical protein